MIRKLLKWVGIVKLMAWLRRRRDGGQPADRQR
jgi:hypothetical protein